MKCGWLHLASRILQLQIHIQMVPTGSTASGPSLSAAGVRGAAVSITKCRPYQAAANAKDFQACAKNTNRTRATTQAAAPTAVGQTSPELRSPEQASGTPPMPASGQQRISGFEHQLSKATQTGNADRRLRRLRTKPGAYGRGQAGRRRVQQHAHQGPGARAGGALCCSKGS